MCEINNKAKIESVELLGPNLFKVAISPLSVGYSMFFANIIRQILFTSVHGYGVTEIKIKNALHEYDSILGIKEDVLNLILNIKNIVFKLKKKKSVILKLVSNKQIITASDFSLNKYVKIVNPNHVIANLNKSTKLNIKIVVEEGIGYVPFKTLDLKKSKIKGIILDTYFCPVESVSYVIEKIFTKSRNDLEKILFFIKTNGSIKADYAIKQAVGMLLYHLSNFKVINKYKKPVKEIKLFSNINKLYFIPITDVELTVRALSCLKKANINYIGDLVKSNEDDLLKVPNLGRKTLKELIKSLKKYGLSLNTEIDNWDNILNEYIKYNNETQNKVKETKC